LNRERAAVRARSIVGLYRQETIGTLPIDEVRADLDRLGVDSAEVIDLARRLASGGNDDPASELLARIEHADAADCEIADFERQSMQRILEALPPDLVDSAKAASDDLATKTMTKPAEPERDEVESEETADGTIAAEIETPDAALAPTRRRGRAAFKIGGSVIGIAASVLLFFAIRPDVLDRFEWPRVLDMSFENWSIPTGGSADDDADLPEAETALAKADNAAPGAPEDDRERLAQGLPIESVPLPSEDELPSSLAEARTVNPDLALAPAVPAPAPDQPRLNDQAGIPPDEAVQPDEAERPAAPQAVLRAEADREQASLAVARAPAPGVSTPAAQEAAIDGSGTLPDNLIGVFILDAERAPAELVALENAGRDDRLGAKRGEASLRALGRRVLALIAFERGGERIEAAVIEAERQAPLGANRVAQVLVEAGALGSDTFDRPGFELLELSRPR
jgi:hypothetical protein